MLADIIPLISAMNYDELKDWIDYIEYHYFASLVPDKEQKHFVKQVSLRRSGIPTGGFPHTGFEDAACCLVLEVFFGHQFDWKHQFYVKFVFATHFF
jgi:hypothetical protein